MDPASSMQIIALVILVLLSAFFSGTETAFTSFNKTRMKTLAQDGNKRAKAVMDVEDQLRKVFVDDTCRQQHREHFRVDHFDTLFYSVH